MKRTLLAVGLVLASVPAVHAQVFAPTGGPQNGLPKAEQYKVRLEYRWFEAKLTSGTLQKGVEGTVVDLTNDLGFVDKSTFQIDGSIQWKPGVKLRGSYMKLDYSGDVVLATNIDFGTNFYPRTEGLSSSMHGGYYGGELEWDVAKGAKGYFGITGGVRVLDIDTVLASPTRGSRNVDTVRSILPALGITARVYMGKRVSLQGDFAGLSSGDRGKVWDGGGAAHLHLSDRLAGTVAYRYIAHTGHDADVRAKLEMEGWQFGGEVSF